MTDVAVLIPVAISLAMAPIDHRPISRSAVTPARATTLARNVAIWRDRQAGATCRECAEWYGITRARVQQIAPGRLLSLSDANLRRLVLRIARGESVSSLAAEYGVRPSAVQTACAVFSGVDVRRPGNRPQASLARLRGQIIADLRSGQTVREIAKSRGIAERRVYDLCSVKSARSGQDDQQRRPGETAAAIGLISRITMVAAPGNVAR